MICAPSGAGGAWQQKPGLLFPLFVCPSARLSGCSLSGKTPSWRISIKPAKRTARKSKRAFLVNDDVELDYNELIQEAQKKAYRFLMRDVLTIIAELGDAPGEHHFFIEFLTGAPDVEIPEHLKAQYPERMTIVLQHQFENLTVDDDQFGVTLWFKNKEARLEIPFDAVTQFADPSAQFGVNFDPVDAPVAENDSSADADDSDASSEDSETPPKDDNKKSDGADVVSLDAFRKK